MGTRFELVDHYVNAAGRIVAIEAFCRVCDYFRAMHFTDSDQVLTLRCPVCDTEQLIAPIQLSGTASLSTHALEPPTCREA